MRETITIYNGAFTATIYLEKLHTLTLVNLRKLFKLMMTDYRNHENEPALEAYLLEVQESTRAAWSEASIQYTNEWKSPTSIDYAVALLASRGPKKVQQERRRLQAKNKRLIARVKSTKAAHVKACKTYDLFQKLK